MIKTAIDEAQGLWDSILQIYDFKGSIPEIEITLNKKLSEGLPSTYLVYLGELNNLNRTAFAQQIYINNILIFIITLTTSKDHETEYPELDWERQLDIEMTTKDLKNIFGLATILHAKTTTEPDILMRVRMKLPFAKGQQVSYSTFGFCQLFKFGDKNKYLLLTKPEKKNEQLCKKFIENDLPYILISIFNLTAIFDNTQSIKNQLDNFNMQIQQHIKGLSELKEENDKIMLAIRKDHVEELYRESSTLKLKFKKLIDEYNVEQIRLQTIVKKLGTIKDDVFSQRINHFKNQYEKLNKWVVKYDNIFKEIYSGYEKYSQEIISLIEKLEKTKDTELDISSKPKTYTVLETSSDKISMEDSPYKRIREDFFKSDELTPEILDTIPLEWCSSYYLIESEPGRSIEIFRELVLGKARFMGLWISRVNKEILNNKYKLRNVPGFQLSTKDTENFLPPILSKISHIINEFLSTNIHSIIYFEGFDFLIKHNDIIRVLAFINNLKDSIVLNDSILIFTVNDSALKKDDLKMICQNSIDLTRSDISLDDLY